MGSCCGKKSKDGKSEVVEDAHLSRFELKVKDDVPNESANDGASTTSKTGFSRQTGNPVQQTGQNGGKPEVPTSQISSPVQAKSPAVCNQSTTSGQNEYDDASVRQELLQELALDTLPVVDSEKALDQSSGDYEFLVELMESYEAQYNKQVHQLRRALQDRDWNCIALEAHSLKGAAANLFIMRMRAICFSLEKTGKTLKAQTEAGEQISQSNISRVAVLLRLLEDKFGEFEQTLGEWKAQAPPT